MSMPDSFADLTVPTRAIGQVAADRTVDTSKGIYNLSGQRMSTTSLDRLPAGIYIVDGRKVIVK